MNIPLLKEIQAAILEEPKRFQMSWWIEESNETPCGTAACIAGHAVIINEVRILQKTLKDFHVIKKIAHQLIYVEENARVLLDISREQSARLFLLDRWPWKYKNRYASSDQIGRAQVACARIEFFILTEGKDTIL